MDGGDPVDDRVAVPSQPAGDETTGHDDDVGRVHIVERVVEVQPQQAVVIRQLPRPGRTENDFGVRELGEHLIGTDGVEGGESRVQADGDLHLQFPRFRRGQNLQFGSSTP